MYIMTYCVDLKNDFVEDDLMTWENVQNILLRKQFLKK